MAGPGEPHNLTSPTVAPPRSRKKDPTTWLVCVDGSEISDRAFQQCLNLAGLADTIHVVHVMARVSYDAPNASQLEYQNQTKAEAFLEPIRRDLRRELGEDGNWVVDCVSGDAKEIIPRKVSAARVDVVVTGTRGLSGLKKLRLGSFSEWLIHHLEVPVLVCH